MHRNGQEDLLDLLVDRPYGKAYSQRLKLEAVQAHLRDGRSLSEATVSSGISVPSLLKRWCKEYRETSSIPSSKQGRLYSKSQNEAPAARIQELEMQADIQ